MKFKKTWFYYIGCLIVPHVMLLVGLVLLAARDTKKKALGKRLCLVSTSILVVGSLLYYLILTPPFGLD